MKCPNCYCEISSSERICRYCGFDIDEHRKRLARDSQETFYRNAMQFYEENYRIEQERNTKYRQWALVGMMLIIVLLNIMTILLLIWK